MIELEKLPIDNRVKELGRIRYLERFKDDRMFRISRSLAFEAGYEFCKAMHKLKDLTKADLPMDEKPRTTVDTALETKT